jgi:hypothetical protein
MSLQAVLHKAAAARHVHAGHAQGHVRKENGGKLRHTISPLSAAVQSLCNSLLTRKAEGVRSLIA